MTIKLITPEQMLNAATSPHHAARLALAMHVHALCAGTADTTVEEVAAGAADPRKFKAYLRYLEQFQAPYLMMHHSIPVAPVSYAQFDPAANKLRQLAAKLRLIFGKPRQLVTA